MTFEEYQRRMKSINETLEAIAKRTANQAALGIADPSNPDFVELMKLHAKLCRETTEITEEMMYGMN